MDTTFLEALETTEKGAKRFKIRVISAGVSKNGNYYSPAALREAAPLFDGVRVLVRSDEDHIQGKGKDFRNLIGRLANPRFIESTAEIRLNFNQQDEIDLAEIIVHEIIHAYTGCNHGEAFQIEAAQKGLIMIAKEGCTIPSRTFTQKAEAILKEIGRAPEGLFSWEDPVFIPDFYCVRNQYGNWDLSRDSAKEAGQIMLLKNETLEMLNQWEKKYFKGLSPKKNRKKIPVLRIPHQTVVSSFYKQSLFMTLLKIFISRSSPKWNAYWTQFNEELKQQEKVAS